MKDVIRNRVLTLLLRAPQLNPTRIREGLHKLPAEFKSLAQIEGRAPAIEVSTEVQQALEPVSASAALALPDAALIHVYWALYWQDKLGMEEHFEPSSRRAPPTTIGCARPMSSGLRSSP